MVIVQVTFTVKPEHIQDFVAITTYNVQHSQQETGITMFELLKDNNLPHKFILFEIYKSVEDQNRHRETEHFKKWKNEVAAYLEGNYQIDTYEKIEA